MLLPLVGCGSALVQSHWQAHSFPPPPRNPESAGAVPPLPPVSSWRKVDTSADASALHQKSARNAYEQNLHHENALRKRITKTATRNPRYHNAEKRRKSTNTICDPKARCKCTSWKACHGSMRCLLQSFDKALTEHAVSVLLSATHLSAQIYGLGSLVADDGSRQHDISLAWEPPRRTMMVPQSAQNERCLLPR